MAFVKGTGVIEAGENKIKFYAKELESASTTVQFADTDLIGELTDFEGAGSEKETKELNGYHYDKKLKSLGVSNDNDVNFTENLTVDELKVIKERYKGNKLVAVGIFINEGKELLFGFCGRISKIGMTVPNGEACTLTYTMTGEETTGYTFNAG